MATRENSVTDSRREVIARALAGYFTDDAARNAFAYEEAADAVLVALGEELEQVGWLNRNGALMQYVEKYAHMATPEDRPVFAKRSAS